MKRWNLYSKAESITVSIGGNVHGVIPYLEDIRYNTKARLLFKIFNDRLSQVIQDEVSDVFQ